jgi:hypothetical protein
MVSANVRAQNSWYYRAMPWTMKQAVLRFSYRFFGESNSSLTLTNLGIVKLPPEIQPYVTDFRCQMTPRVSSPYGCTVLSFGDQITFNISRFGPEDRLGTVFFRNLQKLIENP